MSFIATDGGPHPADKIAAQAARQIGDLIVIDEHSTSESAMAARKQKPRLILDIADAIEQHHADIMADERAALAKSTARLSAAMTPDTAMLDAAVAAVVAAGKSTVFAAGLATPEAKAAIRGVIGNWFVTAIDIERDWVARGHTVGPDGKAQVNPRHKASDPHVAAWNTRRAA